MGVLGALVVSLSLNHSQYVQGLDKSSQESLKFAKTAQDGFDRAKRSAADFVGGVVSGMVAAGAAYLSADALISKIGNSIKRLDELSKTSQRLGIDPGALQELAYAGELADVSLESLATSSKKLSQAMLEAVTGGKEQAATFKALGVEVKNADGSLRASNDVMADVADVFAGLEDGALKTALAVKLFGKSGADMIPLLNGGKKAIVEAREEAHRLGQVLGADALKNAEAFNDNITRLGKIVDGAFNRVAAVALPVLVGLTENLVKATVSTAGLGSEAEKLARDEAMLDWFEGAAVGAATFAEALVGLGKTAYAVGGSLQAAGADVLTLATIFTAGPSAQIEYIRTGTGEIAAAFEARNAMMADANQRWTDLWNYNGTAASDAIRAAFAKQRAALGAGAESVDRQIDREIQRTKSAADARAAAQKRLTDFLAAGNGTKKVDEATRANEQWIDALKRLDIELSEQEHGITKMSAAEKALAQLRDGTIKGVRELTAANRQLRIGEAERLVMRQRAVDLDRLVSEAQIAAAKHGTHLANVETERNASLQANAVALQGQLDLLTLGEEALQDQAVATMRAQAADADWEAQMRGGDATLEERARLLRLVADRTEALAREQGDAKAREGVKQAADAALQEWQKINDQIGQSLADALMAGGRSARDYLKGLFRQLVLQPILRPLTNGIAGFIAAATGGGAMAGTGGGGADLMGLANSYSALSKAYEFYTGSGPGTLAGNYAQIYAQAWDTFATSSYGQSLGYSALAEDAAGNIYLQQTAAGQSAGGAIGSTVSAAGGIVAGHFIGRGISGGYAAGSGSGNTNVNVGTAIGAVVGSIIPVIGTALGAAIGGAIGGLVNRAFGHKAPEVTAQGFTGTFDAGGFKGQEFQDILEKGGWFRSDERYTRPGDAITGDLDKALDAGAAAVREAVKKYGDALGLPADQLLGIAAQVRVQITDDADANAKAIAEALGLYSEALLGAFEDEIEPFRLAGEKVGDTISRLGGTLLVVNESLSRIGQRQFDKTLTGGQAAFDLTELFGGADAFRQAVGQFYQAFTTDAQRTQDLAVELGNAFTGLGLTMPSVTDGVDAAHASYTQLLRAQDLTTESGQKTFAALIGLSGAFDALAQASAAEAMKAQEMADRRTSLEIELLRATGQEMAAVALERERELKALRELDPAMAQVKESIYAAIDAAEAQARQQRIQGGLDSVVGDFLKGDQLAGYLSQRVLDLLGEGGITGDIAGVMGSTRDTIVDLWNAVGTEGKEAILEAYPVWQQLMEVIHGTTDAIKEYREGALADAISEAGFASLKPSDRIRELKNSAEFLKDQIANGDDPVDAAQRLQQVYGWIFEAEDELNAERLDALSKQIDASKKMREYAKDYLKAASDLRTGDLSPYGSAQQLGFAEEAFNETLRKVRSGDTDAAGNLISVANAYIKEASDREASGPRFAGIFENVADTLESLGLSINADPQLELLQDQYDELEALKDNSSRMLEALLSIDALLGGRVGEVIDASNDDEVTTGDVTPIRIESGTISEVAAAIGATPAQAQVNAELQRISAAMAQLVIQTARTGEVADTSEQHLAVSREGAVGIIASVNRLEERMAAMERFVRQENF